MCTFVFSPGEALQIINSKNFPLEEYSSTLFEDMYGYGYEFADSIINRKQYHLFDPMVSDWSCQMRAIWLCCLLKTKSFRDLDDDFFFWISPLALRVCNSC